MVCAGFFKLPLPGGTGFFQNNTSIQKVAILVSFHHEGLPLAKTLGILESGESLEDKVPAIVFRGNYQGLDVALATINGKYAVHSNATQSTVSAALTTHSLIKLMSPDIIINIGTAGGFNNQGLKVGDIVVSSHVVNHDRLEYPSETMATSHL